MSRTVAPERGAVLLMVLIALALLAAIAAAMARLSVAAISASKAEAALMAEQLALPSVLAMVAARLTGPDPVRRDGSPVALALPDRRVEVRLQPVAGLVNPNTAPQPGLVALFRTAGVPTVTATALAARVLAARSQDRPADQARAFRFPSDLRQLLADHPGLWPRLRGLVTVLGGNVNFDPGSAPPALRAMVPAASAATLDLYGGTASADSAAFYELYIRSIDPPRGGVTQVSVRFDDTGYRVVMVAWPEPAMPPQVPLAVLDTPGKTVP